LINNFYIDKEKEPEISGSFLFVTAVLDINLKTCILQKTEQQHFFLLLLQD